MRYLSLNYFDLPPERKYHVYRINASETSQAPHSHSFYQICYVDCGEIQRWSDSAPVLLRFGDTFIVPPNFVHRIVFPDTNAFIYSLLFEEDMFHAGFSYSNVYRFMAALKLDTMNEKHIDIRMKVMLNESQLFIMKALFESLLKESDACTSNDRSAASSLISAIMRVLSQAYFNDEQHKGSLNSLAAYDSSMSVCLEYIDAHFTDPLSLCDHAKRFAFSKTTLSMLFPRYTGVTLKHYIANKRIEYASALIKKASMSLNEIAKIIGYEEFSTFYRNFTSQTGISPSQCRAK